MTNSVLVLLPHKYGSYYLSELEFTLQNCSAPLTLLALLHTVPDNQWDGLGHHFCSVNLVHSETASCCF